MKRKVIIGVVITELVILIAFVYARIIIPALVNNPLMHDIAQDYVGAQALINNNDELYPVLAEAFQEIGISWGAYHQSTHPPTAYLLVLPFALLDYPSAQILWMITMMMCIVLAYKALGLTWRMSMFASALSLAWPPTIWSLGQITPIWLLGLALAYQYRNRPVVSGINIALASLTKFFAASSLLYHLWRKRWKVLIGFTLVWVTALGVILLLRPDAISAYIAANRFNSLEQILRPDNSAFLVAAWRWVGWPGILLTIAFIIYVGWIGLNTEGPSGWACLVWLGIALLPIAWVYSLFPLLPWLGLAVRSSTPVPRMLAIVALLLPFLAPVPTFTPWAITLSIIIAGTSFVLSAKSVHSLNIQS